VQTFSYKEFNIDLFIIPLFILAGNNVLQQLQNNLGHI